MLEKWTDEGERRENERVFVVWYLLGKHIDAG